MRGGGTFSRSSAASTCFNWSDKFPLVCENPFVSSFEMGFMEVDWTQCWLTPFDLLSCGDHDSCRLLWQQHTRKIIVATMMTVCMGRRERRVGERGREKETEKEGGYGGAEAERG